MFVLFFLVLDLLGVSSCILWLFFGILPECDMDNIVHILETIYYIVIYLRKICLLSRWMLEISCV